MWNVVLDETQAGIKIVGRNINSLRYANDTTLMVEREEELKSFLMKVKEEIENVSLKAQRSTGTHHEHYHSGLRNSSSNMGGHVSSKELD